MGIKLDLSELLKEIHKTSEETIKAKVETEKSTKANVEAAKVYKELKDQITSLDSETKRLQEEKKEEVKTTSTLVSSLKEEVELRAKTSKSLTDLEKSYEKLNKSYDKVVKSSKEEAKTNKEKSKAIKKLEKSYESLSSTHEKTLKKMEHITSGVKRQREAYTKLTIENDKLVKSFKKINKQYEANVKNIDALVSKVSKLEEQLKKKKGWKNQREGVVAFNRQLRQFLPFLTTTYLAWKGKELFGDILNVGGDFRQELVKVQAILGSTTSETNTLEKEIRKLGRSTEWTTNQITDAAKFLGMSGLTAEQTTKALHSVLNLATAGQIDLAKAADISTNAMIAMGLEVKDLTRVNDAFIATSTMSNVSIEEMADTFRYAAPKAAAYGYSIEKLTALMGALGNAGIKGSLSGTQLSFAIGKVQSVFKALGQKGEGKDLLDALDAINKAGWSTADVLKKFAERGGRAAIMLRDIVPLVRLFQKQIEESSGISNKIANQMRDTYVNDVKVMKSAFSELGISIFDTWNESLRGAADNITSFITDNKDDIVEFFDHIGKGIRTLSHDLADLVKLLTIGGKLLSSFANAIEDSSFVMSIGAITTAIGGWTLNPVVAGAGIAIMGSTMAFDSTVDSIQENLDDKAKRTILSKILGADITDPNVQKDMSDFSIEQWDNFINGVSQKTAEGIRTNQPSISIKEAMDKMSLKQWEEFDKAAIKNDSPKYNTPETSMAYDPSSQRILNEEYQKAMQEHKDLFDWINSHIAQGDLNEKNAIAVVKGIKSRLHALSDTVKANDSEAKAAAKEMATFQSTMSKYNKELAGVTNIESKMNTLMQHFNIREIPNFQKYLEENKIHIDTESINKLGKDYAKAQTLLISMGDATERVKNAFVGYQKQMDLLQDKMDYKKYKSGTDISFFSSRQKNLFTSKEGESLFSSHLSLKQLGEEYNATKEQYDKKSELYKRVTDVIKKFKSDLLEYFKQQEHEIQEIHDLQKKMAGLQNLKMIEVGSFGYLSDDYTNLKNEIDFKKIEKKGLSERDTQKNKFIASFKNQIEEYKSQVNYYVSQAKQNKTQYNDQSGAADALNNLIASQKSYLTLINASSVQIARFTKNTKDGIIDPLKKVVEKQKEQLKLEKELRDVKKQEFADMHVEGALTDDWATKIIESERTRLSLRSNLSQKDKGQRLVDFTLDIKLREYESQINNLKQKAEEANVSFFDEKGAGDIVSNYIEIFDKILEKAGESRGDIEKANKKFKDSLTPDIEKNKIKYTLDQEISLYSQYYTDIEGLTDDFYTLKLKKAQEDYKENVQLLKYFKVANAEAIAESMKKLEEYNAMKQIGLASGGMTEGIGIFFTDMEKEMTHTAQFWYDTMTEINDKLAAGFSDIMFNVITGKTNEFSSMFTNLGNSLLRKLTDTMAKNFVTNSIMKPLEAMFPKISGFTDMFDSPELKESKIHTTLLTQIATNTGKSSSSLSGGAGSGGLIDGLTTAVMTYAAIKSGNTAGGVGIASNWLSKHTGILGQYQGMAETGLAIGGTALSAYGLYNSIQNKNSMGMLTSGLGLMKNAYSLYENYMAAAQNNLVIVGMGKSEEAAYASLDAAETAKATSGETSAVIGAESDVAMINLKKFLGYAGIIASIYSTVSSWDDMNIGGKLASVSSSLMAIATFALDLGPAGWITSGILALGASLFGGKEEKPRIWADTTFQKTDDENLYNTSIGDNYKVNDWGSMEGEEGKEQFAQMIDSTLNPYRFFYQALKDSDEENNTDISKIIYDALPESLNTTIKYKGDKGKYDDTPRSNDPSLYLQDTIEPIFWDKAGPEIFDITTSALQSWKDLPNSTYNLLEPDSSLKSDTDYILDIPNLLKDIEEDRDSYISQITGLKDQQETDTGSQDLNRTTYGEFGDAEGTIRTDAGKEYDSYQSQIDALQAKIDLSQTPEDVLQQGYSIDDLGNMFTAAFPSQLIYDNLSNFLKQTIFSQGDISLSVIDAKTQAWGDYGDNFDIQASYDLIDQQIKDSLNERITGTLNDTGIALVSEQMENLNSDMLQSADGIQEYREGIKSITDALVAAEQAISSLKSTTDSLTGMDISSLSDKIKDATSQYDAALQAMVDANVNDQKIIDAQTARQDTIDTNLGVNITGVTASTVSNSLLTGDFVNSLQNTMFQGLQSTLAGLFGSASVYDTLFEGINLDIGTKVQGWLDGTTEITQEELNSAIVGLFDDIDWDSIQVKADAGQKLLTEIAGKMLVLNYDKIGGLAQQQAEWKDQMTGGENNSNVWLIDYFNSKLKSMGPDFDLRLDSGKENARNYLANMTGEQAANLGLSDSELSHLGDLLFSNFKDGLSEYLKTWSLDSSLSSSVQQSIESAIQNYSDLLSSAQQKDNVNLYQEGQVFVDQWGTSDESKQNVDDWVSTANPEDWKNMATYLNTTVEALQETAYLYGHTEYAKPYGQEGSQTGELLDSALREVLDPFMKSFGKDLQDMLDFGLTDDQQSIGKINKHANDLKDAIDLYITNLSDNDDMMNVIGDLLDSSKEIVNKYQEFQLLSLQKANFETIGQSKANIMGMTDEYNSMTIGSKYGIDLTSIEQKQNFINTFLNTSSAGLVTMAGDYGVSVSEMTTDMGTLNDIVNQTSDTFSDLADSLDSYKTSLAISDKSYLDPELKTQIAKQSFDKLIEQSMSSSPEVAQQAMQDLPGAADTYLSLAQKTDTSILGYNASMSYVLSALQNTEDYAETYTKTTDDSQDELENQTKILKDSVDATESIDRQMEDILTSEDFNNYVTLFNSFANKDDMLVLSSSISNLNNIIDTWDVDTTILEGWEFLTSEDREALENANLSWDSESYISFISGVTDNFGLTFEESMQGLHFIDDNDFWNLDATIKFGTNYAKYNTGTLEEDLEFFKFLADATGGYNSNLSVSFITNYDQFDEMTFKEKLTKLKFLGGEYGWSSNAELAFITNDSAFDTLSVGESLELIGFLTEDEGTWDSRATLSFVTNTDSFDAMSISEKLELIGVSLDADKKWGGQVSYELIAELANSGLAWNSIKTVLGEKGVKDEDILKKITGEYVNNGMSISQIETILGSWGVSDALIATVTGNLNIVSNTLLTETTFENFASAFLQSSMADTYTQNQLVELIFPEMAEFWHSMSSATFGDKSVYSINDFITLAYMGLADAINNISIDTGEISFPDSMTISGTVEISNFPSSITVSNFPSSMTVTGTIHVSELQSGDFINGLNYYLSNIETAINNIKIAVGGIFSPSFPSSMSIYGTVGISNFPSSVTVYGTVHVSELQSGNFINGLNYYLQGINDKLRDLNKGLHISGYAEGGISTGSPTGHLEMLHGTEAVIPLKSGSIPVTIMGKNSYNAPSYATGGYHPGGLAFVGEEGVELMNAPPSTFTSHNDTKTLLTDSNVDVVKELQNLRKENKITKDELMAANIQLIKLTNKINNRDSKWDNEGLPAERIA